MIFYMSFVNCMAWQTSWKGAGAGDVTRHLAWRACMVSLNKRTSFLPMYTYLTSRLQRFHRAQNKIKPFPHYSLNPIYELVNL